ncbi:MAG: type I-U CRISPR-associated protein Cas7 [Phycisphaeraceae bacterium]|nr:type I-U CRISPR-associated protein Cas7 [Phycisphaeraceae bacterium]
MKTDLSPLDQASRLLLNVELTPLQGTRFQPTGFPDLGAATYQAGEVPCLLVESAQSMANRLEAVCWDEASNELKDTLQGLSYIRVEENGQYLTSSITEAHRINSPYIEYAQDKAFHQQLAEEINYSENAPIDRPHFLKTIFKYDPNSLIHGVFLESIAGRLRIARSLSSFIEATNTSVVASGGVKNDHIQPSPNKAAKRAAAEGFGNVPFSREEYTAQTITAYFCLDLNQIRGYGLPEEAQTLLILLSLYKIRVFLDGDMRLRTACDFAVKNPDTITAQRPAEFTLPSLGDLEADIPTAIEQCKSLMAGVTTVVYSK